MKPLSCPSKVFFVWQTMKCGRATHVICEIWCTHDIVITLSKEEIHTNVKNMNARRDNDARVSNKIEPVEGDSVWW